MTITIDPGVRPAPLTDAERIATLERQVADLKEQRDALQAALLEALRVMAKMDPRGVARWLRQRLEGERSDSPCLPLA